jgi:ATP-dependent Lon protease
MKEHGLQKKELQITQEGLEFIIDKYAREAGVRNLENQLKKIMRQITLKMTENSQKKYVITPKNVEDFLGKPVFAREELYEKSIPGVTLGLAWTAMGGATLYIEANALKAKGPAFKQTGKLGEVMTESSEIAYSYVRSLLSENEEVTQFFDEHSIHLHVPEGATPKDGPSAGITMALALYSLAVNKPVKTGIAMTGEITLTGKVLPIGGVREKTIAAKRIGINELIFPKDNKYDFEHLPDYIRKGVKVHYVNYFDDVLKVAMK